jgi:hypothetical protein
MTYKEYVEVCEECGLTNNSKAPFYHFFYGNTPIAEFRTTRDKGFGFYNVVPNTEGAARIIYDSLSSEIILEKENLIEQICNYIKEIKEKKIKEKLEEIKNDF